MTMSSHVCCEPVSGLSLPGGPPPVSLADARIAVVSDDAPFWNEAGSKIESRGPTVRRFHNIDAWLLSVSGGDAPESAASAADDCLILHAPLDDEATLAAIAKVRQRRL